MKLNEAGRNGGSVAAGGKCRASGRKALAQVIQVKAAIFAESSPALQTQERLLRLALNEAEAVARQTPYPHLVFPTLATEKVEAVIAWNRRQQSLRGAGPDLVLAA